MDGTRGRKCMEGGESEDINRILLRYRPIAPKPVAGSGGGSTFLNEKRTKRKYVRVSSGRFKGRNKAEKQIVTLQLLPEKADLKAEITQLSVRSVDSNSSDLRVVEQNNNINDNFINIWYAAEVGIGVGGVIKSWVTVESIVVDERVTEASGWFVSDEDKLLMNDNLLREQFEAESFPGFIAKAESGRAEWVNEAYSRMVGWDSGGSKTVVICLEIKEEVVKVISKVRSAFSCWVKLHYNSEEDGRRGVSMLLPCDAWRVQHGAFAWRLDTRAALCMGSIADNDGCIRRS